MRNYCQRAMKSKGYTFVGDRIQTLLQEDNLGDNRPVPYLQIKNGTKNWKKV